MLNEFTEVQKERIAVVDCSFFLGEQLNRINIRIIRQLIYGLTSSWTIILVYTENQKVALKRTLEECEHFGIPIYKAELVTSIKEFKEIARISDIGYTPLVLKTLPVNFLLRPPHSAEAMAEVICHFANAEEPFSPDNYYAFLNSYGS